METIAFEAYNIFCILFGIICMISCFIFLGEAKVKVLAT